MIFCLTASNLTTAVRSVKCCGSIHQLPSFQAYNLTTLQPVSRVLLIKSAYTMEQVNTIRLLTKLASLLDASGFYRYANIADKLIRIFLDEEESDPLADRISQAADMLEEIQKKSPSKYKGLYDVYGPTIDAIMLIVDPEVDNPPKVDQAELSDLMEDMSFFLSVSQGL